MMYAGRRCCCLKIIPRILVWILAFLLPVTMLLVNWQRLLAVFCVVCLALIGAYAILQTPGKAVRIVRWPWLELAGVTTGILWITGGWYDCYVLMCLFSLIVFAKYSLLGAVNMIRRKNSGIRKCMTALLLVILWCVYAICNWGLVSTTISPIAYVGPIQRLLKAENLYSTLKYEDEIALLHGEYVYTDICYSNQYPNSYLDIYRTSGDADNKPTIIYIHGGGYIGGNKTAGDPWKRTNGFSWYVRELLQEGYNIVSVDYAFAPEYRYPQQLRQVNEAMDFLMKRGRAYQISMDRVILEGRSAGGNIAGMLGLITTQPAIAQEFGVRQYIPKENLKAVVFMSALINNQEFSVTHNTAKNYMFFQYARVAFRSNTPSDSEIAARTNIINRVDENYTPTYISDGNYASFYSQARALHRRLDALGVKNTFNWYPRSAEKLNHGYEMNMKYYSTQKNIRKTIAFLNRNVRDVGKRGSYATRP